jgi:hypothetical protein
VSKGPTVDPRAPAVKQIRIGEASSVERRASRALDTGPSTLTSTLNSLFLCALLTLTSCTALRVTQRDECDGRQITTTLSATAWFSSAQHFAKLRTTQTDKTQGIGTEGLGQQGATNSVAALEAVARILEALRPVP